MFIELLAVLTIDSTDENEKTIFEGLQSATDEAFRDEFFKSLGPFQNAISTIIESYPGPGVATVVDSLNIQQLEDLKAWVAAEHSQLLWLDGCLAPGFSDWTSDLSLEIVGMSSIAKQQNSEASRTTTLFHFCEPLVHDVQRTPTVVVQDLIYQLIEAHTEKFTKEACLRYKLTKQQLLRAERSRSLSTLWKLFITCIFVSKVSALQIIIDKIDCLSTPSDVTGKSPENTDELIQGLINMSQLDGPSVKLFITMRSGFIPRHISERLKPPRQVILHVPVPPNRMRPRIARPGVVRRKVTATAYPTRSIVQSFKDSWSSDDDACSLSEGTDWGGDLAERELHSQNQEQDSNNHSDLEYRVDDTYMMDKYWNSSELDYGNIPRPTMFTTAGMSGTSLRETYQDSMAKSEGNGSFILDYLTDDSLEFPSSKKVSFSKALENERETDSDELSLTLSDGEYDM